MISNRRTSADLTTRKTMSYLGDSNKCLFNLQYDQAKTPRHSPDPAKIGPLLVCRFIQWISMSTKFTNMTLSLARITTSLTGGLIASVIAVAPVSAQNLPNWQPSSICSSDSATGQCLLFEQRAKNDVTASWSVLPQSSRTSCLARFEAPLKPSWRILGDCIEIEGRRAQQARVAAKKKREDEALAQLISARSNTRPTSRSNPI